MEILMQRSQEKPFKYLIYDWMAETGQDPKKMIDACFMDYVEWFKSTYPRSLDGYRRETVEAWWDAEVGLDAWFQELKDKS